MAEAEAAPEEAPLQPWEESALEALRWHWGDAYEIGVSGGRWRAKRRDGLGGQIEAPDDRPGPDGLGWAIADDYQLKPVPRDAGTMT